MAKSSGSTRTSRPANRRGNESAIENAFYRESVMDSDTYSNSEGWYKSSARITEVKVTKTDGDIVSATVSVEKTYKNNNPTYEAETDYVTYDVQYNKRTKEIESYKNRY